MNHEEYRELLEGGEHYGSSKKEDRQESNQKEGC